jgi:hypothetical protein
VIGYGGSIVVGMGSSIVSLAAGFVGCRHCSTLAGTLVLMQA